MTYGAAHCHMQREYVTKMIIEVEESWVIALASYGAVTASRAQRGSWMGDPGFQEWWVCYVEESPNTESSGC